MFAIRGLLVSLLLAQASPAADPVGRISGRVTVDGPNTVVEAETVTLYPEPSTGFAGVRSTRTDYDGRFSFDRVAPGHYQDSWSRAGGPHR
jgi:hypothetical protein